MFHFMGILQTKEKNTADQAKNNSILSYGKKLNFQRKFMQNECTFSFYT